jgi:hypothetical protein
VPEEKGTKLTILASVDVQTTEADWIVSMALKRSPVDWCAVLEKAVVLYQAGQLKAVDAN